MRRRDLFIGALGIACSAATNCVAQSVRRKRLAYLSGGKQTTYTIDVLKASLRDLGWRENETIEIDARWADGDPSRLASLAQELVQLRPDVIATTGDSETKALQLATQDIPIVFHLWRTRLQAGWSRASRVQVETRLASLKGLSSFGASELNCSRNCSGVSHVNSGGLAIPEILEAN
jgi:hypothetical protein